MILKKYEYLYKIKNYLEYTQLKLNDWINLIFGVNQKKSKKKETYYEKYMYIHFDKEIQTIIMNNPLNMQKFEFGIQPIQLFDKKFPELKDKSKFFQDIKLYNMKQFKKEHYIMNENKNQYFICLGYKNIQFDYINIINSKIINKKRPPAFFHYIFTGDVLGNITIYKFKYNGNNNIPLTSIDYNIDKSYKVMKKLTDHYKQIKYIDYSPRLNLFLSYSLDGFINIYEFPKCKLVRAIKVKNFTKSDDILEQVVLVSNPFPMIFTYDKKMMYMYTITLNGKLIKKKEINIKNNDIIPCIDKNCGIINDFIYFIYKNNEENKQILKEISLPLLSY